MSLLLGTSLCLVALVVAVAAAASAAAVVVLVVATAVFQVEPADYDCSIIHGDVIDDLTEQQWYGIYVRPRLVFDLESMSSDPTGNPLLYV